MRDILFRAFVKDKQKIYNIKKIDFDYRIVWFEEENKATDTMRMFDQIELMQFTGLTDKNGKKIFEGDIVKLFFYDKEQGINYELIGQVESVLCCGFITIYEEKVNALELFNKTISNKIEVIGTVFDKESDNGD